jgi:hypothetical protein
LVKVLVGKGMTGRRWAGVSEAVGRKLPVAGLIRRECTM